MGAALLIPLLFAMLMQDASQPATDTVRLDFPEVVELKIVVDYVAQTLGLSIYCDEDLLQNKRVALRVAAPVPRSELLGLLRSLLRARGLALLSTERTGWLRIIPVERLAAEAGAARADIPPDLDPADVVAVAVALQRADLERAKAAVLPLLSKPGGSVQAQAESRTLVITDFVSNVHRALEAIARLDSDEAGPQVQTIPVQNQDPTELVGLLNRFLAERARTEGAAAAVVAGPVLQADVPARRIIASGTREQLSRVRELARELDTPGQREARLLQPRYLPVSRAKALADQLLASAGLKLVADENTNTLVASGRPEDLNKLDELLQRFDTAPGSANTPLRFYRVMNRRAVDVFATLGAILGQGTSAASGAEPASPAGKSVTPSKEPAGGAGAGRTAMGDDAGDVGPSRATGALTAIRGEGFSISTDEHTNTIIVIGPADLHAQVEQIIARLDRRRPQVLVEVTLVSISEDDGTNLGVELEALDLGHPWDYLLFTSFGLSTITPTTGARRMTPLPGGSGALIAPDEVPFIIQALASNGRTRVYSAPRILVDDNATGRIESVAEAPFTSVNASDTVATTSFAGFAKAGTQLSIEPHIAEGNHLEIRYDLTVSSFTGAGIGGAPPPRSADTISSSIRVPDGYTVVVGGLVTETLGNSAAQVPLIGDVPLLGWLFGNRSTSASRVRLYAFIRPTVLRSEEFEDLKYISSDQLREAKVDDGFPPDRVQWMR